MGFIVGSHRRCAAVPARKARPGHLQEALDNPATTKVDSNLVTLADQLIFLRRQDRFTSRRRYAAAKNDGKPFTLDLPPPSAYSTRVAGRGKNRIQVFLCEVQR
jgi:hypothetical protein